MTPNKQLATDFINALGALDSTKAAALTHSDYQCHFPTITMQPDTYDTKALVGFIDGLANILQRGIRFEIIELTEEANKVSVVAKGFATTVDNTPYNNNYHFLFYIEEGKIIKHLEFMDSFLGVKVLGPIMKRLASRKNE